MKKNLQQPEVKKISRVPLKGWDVLKILTDKQGKSKESKSFTKTNPITSSKVRQQGLKHL